MNCICRVLFMSDSFSFGALQIFRYENIHKATASTVLIQFQPNSMESMVIGGSAV